MKKAMLLGLPLLVVVLILPAAAAAPAMQHSQVPPAFPLAASGIAGALAVLGKKGMR